LNSVNVTSIENRMPALDWLGTESNSLVVGGPGSGKSALLKYLVLGLLEQIDIKNQNIIRSKNLLIPVWLPFGYWSNYLVNKPESSLIDCLESWFSSMDREDLWSLIQTAISDNRLFLVVDGIDEWKSEQSALICINKLAVFLSERKASSIISSRPSGVEKLGLKGFNWTAAYLEGLSGKQQAELVSNCINYRLTHQLGTEDPSFDFEFKKQSHELSSEILVSRDLSELASVPLLLYMLIHLKSKNISLPHSRFSVYRELINDLIKVQPKRRKTAAQVLDEGKVFSESELFSILSQLAFKMHVKYPHGSIDLFAAEKLICEYLSDEKNEFYSASTILTGQRQLS
jgi:predicted NACHT family NTPase